MARHDFSTPRLFTTQALAAGTHVPLDRKQANYLGNVMRLKPGAKVRVFNGRDGEWGARLASTGRRDARLAVEARLRPQEPVPALHFLFAPLRQARLGYVVEKAVEMGAGRLTPVLTQHTQVRAVNRERLAAHVIEAAEQCGVTAVPEIDAPVTFETLIDGWPAASGSRALVVCDEAESASGGDPLAALAPLRGREIAVLIGPEGGFSREERELFHAQEFVVVLPLGPRILRADTAAVAALALVQAVAGDWRGGPDGGAATAAPAEASPDRVCFAAPRRLHRRLDQ